MATQIEKGQDVGIDLEFMWRSNNIERDKKEIISVHMVYATRVVQVGFQNSQVFLSGEPETAPFDTGCEAGKRISALSDADVENI